VSHLREYGSRGNIPTEMLCSEDASRIERIRENFCQGTVASIFELRIKIAGLDNEIAKLKREAGLAD
jgi:hypothetical protein